MSKSKIESRIRAFSGIVAICTILLPVCGCSEQVKPAMPHSEYVLLNAGIIDSRGVVATGSTALWIRDGTIAFVGDLADTLLPDSIPSHDLTGKWITPGLMDLHVHLPTDREVPEVLRTLLAFGITTARSGGAVWNSDVDIAEDIRHGSLLGPTVYAAGRLIDAPGSVHSSAVTVETTDAAREAVRLQASNGVNHVKVYVGLEDSLVAAVIDEAHRLNLPVMGHLGKTDWTKAASLGIDVLTHSGFAGPTWELVPEELRVDHDNAYIPGRGSSIPALADSWLHAVDLSGSMMDSLAEAVLQNDVEINPTLVLTWAMLFGNRPENIDRFEVDYATKKQRRDWAGSPHPFSRILAELAPRDRERLYNLFAEVVKRIHGHGGLVTTGTDLGVPWMTPGVALHVEMQLMVEAGLSPLEALRAATINGAEALGIDNSTGDIRESYEADLLVLTANPVSAIGNMRNIEMVINNGIAYYPQDLLP